MKIFQIVNGHCHWQTPFGSLEETKNFPADCLFVEAPDYVNEQWGYDETEIGDDRFIPPDIPEGFVYDEDSGQVMEAGAREAALSDAKDAKQAKNNEKLANYLATHPMTWVDGKQYGITKEDQNEIAMNLMSYQNDLALGVENPRLEWHAIHEACTPWTIENLSALSSAIREAVYPWYNKNQEYKTQIYACTSVSQLDEIQLIYGDETPEVMPGEPTLEEAPEAPVEG